MDWILYLQCEDYGTLFSLEDYPIPCHHNHIVDMYIHHKHHHHRHIVITTTIISLSSTNRREKFDRMTSIVIQPTYNQINMVLHIILSN